MAAHDPQTSLHVRRTVAAPRKRVFRAWTEPQALEHWFRPMGYRISVTTLELHVGGGYRFELLDQDTVSGYIMGTYLEIAPPERLVFTWVSDGTRDEQTLVTVEFIEKDDHTEIRLTHDRLADEAMVLAHQNGWESCLDQLQHVF